MQCRLSRCFLIAIIFMALLVMPALAQDDAADPFSYIPTGDELYDTYAQALLAELAGAKPWDLLRLDLTEPVSLPETYFEEWNSRFGDDPRYWQLRYWEAIWHGGSYVTGLDAAELLEQGIARGTSDNVTAMLAYKYRRQLLKDNWDRYSEGTLPPESGFAPQIPPGICPYSWYTAEQLALADELVAECPEESWAWYERATVRFESGSWEGGLADLEHGNAAPNNRLPLPFPVSFIIARMEAGLPCGNEAAAGLILSPYLIWRMPNFIRVKDPMKNQLVRMQMGADLSEFAPWHEYTCRYGSMSGTYSTHWLLARVLHGMMLNYIFTETPELFTVEQRSALWSLNGRMYKIRMLGDQAGWDTDDLVQALEEVGAQHGIDIDDEPGVPPWFMFTAEGIAFSRDVQAAYFANTYRHYQAIHGELYNKVKDRFEMLAEFDFETYSWPPPG